MDMKTERLVILLTPEQKQTIMAQAKALNLSAAEMVRRSVEGYRPSEEEAMLSALADELERSAKRTRKALVAARNEVRQTLDYFARRRLASKAA
jgi:hypothetical protein